MLAGVGVGCGDGRERLKEVSTSSGQPATANKENIADNRKHLRVLWERSGARVLLPGPRILWLHHEDGNTTKC